MFKLESETSLLNHQVNISEKKYFCIMTEQLTIKITRIAYVVELIVTQ